VVVREGGREQKRGRHRFLHAHLYVSFTVQWSREKRRTHQALAPAVGVSECGEDNLDARQGERARAAPSEHVGEEQRETSNAGTVLGLHDPVCINVGIGIETEAGAERRVEVGMQIKGGSMCTVTSSGVQWLRSCESSLFQCSEMLHRSTSHFQVESPWRPIACVVCLFPPKQLYMYTYREDIRQGVRKRSEHVYGKQMAVKDTMRKVGATTFNLRTSPAP
jgi:hypothetical protein